MIFLSINEKKIAEGDDAPNCVETTHIDAREKELKQTNKSFEEINRCKNKDENVSTMADSIKIQSDAKSFSKRLNISQD